MRLTQIPSKGTDGYYAAPWKNMDSDPSVQNGGITALKTNLMHSTNGFGLVSKANKSKIVN